MKRVILTILLALNLAVPGVFAASEKGYNSHFGDMDTNNDKGVTWEEFKAFFAQAEQEKFQEADMNKDGKIDHGEWHKFKDKYGYGHVNK